MKILLLDYIASNKQKKTIIFENEIVVIHFSCRILIVNYMYIFYNYMRFILIEI
jgi:hypothetical protein